MILGSRFPPYNVSLLLRSRDVHCAERFFPDQVKKESWLRNVLGAKLPPRPLPQPGSDGESKVDFSCMRPGWELID